MELCDQSASELVRRLKKREISSREITESVFRRIEEREKDINAFVTTTRDVALRQADQSDRRYRAKESLSRSTASPRPSRS